MTCFCNAPASTLPQLVPPEPLRIRAIPPQLSDLARLLGLSNMGGDMMMRADLRLSQVLPDMPPDSWMRTTLSATMPRLQLPRHLPFGPGPLISATLQLSLFARVFPITDPKRLIAAIRQAMASFAQTTLPAARPLLAMVTPDFLRLTDAARITLTLRKQGLCPLALSGVDPQFSLGEGLAEPRETYTGAMHAAVRISSQPIQPFAMTPAQVRLAAHFAGMAGLPMAHEPLNLPPASDPSFPTAAQALIRALSAIPMPPLPLSPDKLLEMAGVLEAIDTIKEAFGQDALEPTGTTRINAMLRYVERLTLPRLGPAVFLNEQIALLPPFDMVETGAMAARSSSATLAASMTGGVPNLAFAPALDAINALIATMSNALGMNPLGPCTACEFPIDNFLPAA